MNDVRNLNNTSPVPVNRTDLMSAFINDKRVSRVEIKHIKLAPGQKAGCHFHPCPVVGYISQGAVLFQIEGGFPILLKTGEAFFEPANKNILHFDNASPDTSLEFIAFYLLSENDSELIKMGSFKDCSAGNLNVEKSNS